ncbi:SGNH/GDSL hydrolase family protein [Kitasatospora sp. NBC_01539]|uniref:SGNH/GDSL hydrolase family protein n=1 Tax=Kitasatospora sp. NBC_01539 TaxID=2903577 RepID=UPI0038602D67
MGHRYAVAGLAAVALLLAAGCGAADGGARSAAPPSGTPTASAAPTRVAGPYAALGDSYTSGLGVAPRGGGPAGCGRSAVDYPALVARGLGIAPGAFTDASCSDARTADLATAQRTADGTNPPQLDALGADTRLVTLGIGGNDAGFMDVVARCVRENLRPAADTAAAPCRAAYAADGGAGPDGVQRAIGTAGDGVAAALAEIRRRAPRAAVYVVGYPELLPADPDGCAEAVGGVMATGDLRFLREKQQQLNTTLRDRAAAAGAVFVDTAAASAGHDMCAGAAVRWIEPVRPAAGAAALHPNARGESGMAAAVLAAVRSAGAGQP